MGLCLVEGGHEGWFLCASLLIIKRRACILGLYYWKDMSARLYSSWEAEHDKDN